MDKGYKVTGRMRMSDNYEMIWPAGSDITWMGDHFRLVPNLTRKTNPLVINTVRVTSKINISKENEFFVIDG